MHQSTESVVFGCGVDWWSGIYAYCLRDEEAEVGWMVGRYSTKNPAGHENCTTVEHEKCYAPVTVAAVKCWLGTDVEPTEGGVGTNSDRCELEPRCR